MVHARDGIKSEAFILLMKKKKKQKKKKKKKRKKKKKETRICFAVTLNCCSKFQLKFKFIIFHFTIDSDN